MKAEEIKGLIDFIAKSGLDEVNVETESFKISVKRNNITVQATASQAVTPIAVQAESQAVNNVIPVQQASTTQATPPADNNANANDEDKYVPVTSPMIGTFYRSPNPDTPAFVNVGDKISTGQTVCIIEAMKLFNEIESEVSGTVVKVLVDNASPVEYDQPLFLVDPS